MYLRPVTPRDRDQLLALLQRIENFTDAEKQVARDLIHDALDRPESGYRCLVALDADGENEICLGYLCFGQTPMTRHTYDLYWIVVDPAQRRRGVAHRLLVAFEELLRQTGGKIVRVETSTQESYGGTLQFYKREGFAPGGRIPHFYKQNDDLLIFYKVVE
jgi:ribosomal protein S18 acetylase RimI-like enzyme